MTNSLLIAIILIMGVAGAPGSFAVTEPCEEALVSDPFYRLISKALDDRLLTAEDLRRLAESDVPMNPLARLTKDNPALFKALEAQVQAMTRDRWAQLRVGLNSLAAKASGENSARAEAREETAGIWRLEKIADTPFAFEDRAWIQQGPLLILAGSYPEERLEQDLPEHGLKFIRLNKDNFLRHLFMGPNGKALAAQEGFMSPSLVELESGRRIRSIKPYGVAGYADGVGLFSFSIENGTFSTKSKLIARPQGLLKRLLPSVRAAVGYPEQTFDPVIYKVLHGKKYIYVLVQTQTAVRRNLEIFQFDGQSFRQIHSIENFNGIHAPVNRGDELYWVNNSGDNFLQTFDGQRNFETQIDGSIKKIMPGDNGEIVVQYRKLADFRLARVGVDGIRQTSTIPVSRHADLLGLVPFRGGSAAVLYDSDVEVLHLVELESGQTVLSEKWKWRDTKMIALANGKVFLAARTSEADPGQIFLLSETSRR